jgi:aldose 1-epimerase
MRAATGTQYDLTSESPNGRATATITEVAAGIRAYALNGIDLVETFAASVEPPMSAGIVLVPWPNRIKDGIWRDGEEWQQLSITEPLLNNAIHGLLRSTPYRLVERDGTAVTLAATVFPQPGYPFQLDTSVTYALTDTGLDVTHTVHNVGPGNAPVAIGVHPYVKIGDVPTRDLVLRVDADTHLEVDARLNPTGVDTPVDGTDYDLRSGRRVAELALDDAFGGAGREHSLTAPDGRRVTVWGDENMRYVQVFTPTGFPVTVADGRTIVPGRAVAIEPMTAPADAFNSGAGLRWLAPDETWTVRWGIRPTGFQA